MKVTFVLPFVQLAGGVRVVATYASALRERGHDVHVVSTPGGTPSLRRRLRSVWRGRGWPRRPKPDFSFFDGSDVTHHVIDRWRPLRPDDVPDADVIIATWWQTAEWVWPLPPSKGAKVHFVQGNDITPGQPRERVEATWRLPMHRIVVSEWLASLVSPQDPSQVHLIPNAVDTRRFDAPPRSKNTRPTVGTLYTLHGDKGCALALEAVRSARRRIPELQLVCFGSQPEAPTLPLPESTQLFVRPDQQLIPSLYARCDAWLFASRQEGFGLPILEAMACRTPVIATPAGAAPQLLGDGAGRLVDRDDPQQMADAIVELAGMPATQWEQLSSHAYERAHRYAWIDAIKAFEAELVSAATQAERSESSSPLPAALEPGS